MQALLEDLEKPAGVEDLNSLKAHVVELTAIAEREIHDVVIGARILREQEGAMKEKTGAGVH
jgi:hypothetical protein